MTPTHITVVVLVLLLGAVSADTVYCESPVFTISPVAGYEPVIMQLVFRHGDRSSWLTYRNDDRSFDCGITEQLRLLDVQGIESKGRVHLKTVIDRDRNVFAKDFIFKGDCHLGQLTRKGLNQLAAIGDGVRTKYITESGFLPERLNLSEIYVRSTIVWRVIQSAESFLQHLYPPSARSPTDRIKIDVVPASIEYSQYNWGTPCTALDELNDLLFTKFFPNELSRRTTEPYATIINKARRMFGEQTDNWFDSYFDILQETECTNQPFPCQMIDGEQLCFTQEEFDTLVDLIYYENTFRFYDSETIPIARLSSGWLLRDLLNNMEARINGTTPIKYAHYHAHDTTIYPMLSLLEADYSAWPPYASYIMFELTKKDDEYFVRVAYNNQLLAQPSLTPVDEQNKIYRWEDFAQHYRKKIPVVEDCFKQY